MTSLIQTNDSDTSRFLNALEIISAQQAQICEQLDQLTLLMQMPSESVFRVLHKLLLPMDQDMRRLTKEVRTRIEED